MPNDKSVQHMNVSPIQVLTSSIFDELSFIRWWYTEVTIWLIRLFKRVAIICDDTFSISILLRTFFIPWHRDYSITGRIFGIIIRLLYLPVALIITATILMVIVAFMLIWVTLPAIFIFNFINSLPE